MTCEIQRAGQKRPSYMVSKTQDVVDNGSRSQKRVKPSNPHCSNAFEFDSAEGENHKSAKAAKTKRGPGERQRGPRHWTEEEDSLLKAAVSKVGARQWKVVAMSVPGRTHTQCLQRWNKVLKPGLRKGPWTESEDAKLRELVQTELPKAKEAARRCSDTSNEVDPTTLISWGAISESIPGRSIKQCRERWCYNLNPNVKKGGWTKEEDEILLTLQKKNGNRWAQIARLIPGRTEHTVKTRFRSILRARKREWKPHEDSLLLELHRKLGSRWDEIAGHFPNRTKNAVNTRFKHLVEQKWKKQNKEFLTQPAVSTQTAKVVIEPKKENPAPFPVLAPVQNQFPPMPNSPMVSKPFDTNNNMMIWQQMAQMQAAQVHAQVQAQVQAQIQAQVQAQLQTRMANSLDKSPYTSSLPIMNQLPMQPMLNQYLNTTSL
mmetsp:Transcript_13603/g.17729  ORF Transcript_13603/g.17729 Transcript_13603/m.17729 type:complete len:431 (-) Transcript_13603:97-1389(-)